MNPPLKRALDEDPVVLIGVSKICTRGLVSIEYGAPTPTPTPVSALVGSRLHPPAPDPLVRN